MRWRKRVMQSINSDIEEAQRLRAEALAQRAQLHRESNLIQTVVKRRELDGFGDEVQITFTRREA